jgi:hypothetical protein
MIKAYGKITILLAGGFLALLPAMAQTKRIAHRSHGGGHSFFTVKGDGNWGVIRRHIDNMPPVRIQPDTATIIKVNPALRKDTAPKKDTVKPKNNPLYTRRMPAKKQVSGK